MAAIRLIYDPRDRQIEEATSIGANVPSGSGGFMNL